MINGLAAIVLPFVISNGQPAQRPPNLALYHEMHAYLEDAGLERGCITRGRQDSALFEHSSRLNNQKRLESIDRLIADQYPQVAATDPPIGGLARVMDCGKVKGARSRFLSALSTLEERLGGK